MRSSDKGKTGERIAKQLWPSLFLVPKGSFDDLAGIDAYDGDDPVQIKYDSTIKVTGNIYHEIYEKTKGMPWQPWRVSPKKGKWYIFVTGGFAVRVAIAELAEKERGKVLTQISDTSLGFLVPLSELEGKAEIKLLNKETK